VTSEPRTSAASRVDTLKNRQAKKYGFRELVGRVLWGLCQPLFRLSPRPLFGCRRWLLRCFGARIGAQVHIYNSARISLPWNLEVGDWSAIGEGARVYNLGPVVIGRHVTISPNAHLCAGTHDYRDPAMPLLRPPIIVEDDVWICADAFVGPNVVVGAGAIVGARAVAIRNVPAWTIVAGNPARVIREREPAPQAADTRHPSTSRGEVASAECPLGG
jgi:putative colanic acid biosynthesis acetyltransferase WcaF